MDSVEKIFLQEQKPHWDTVLFIFQLFDDYTMPTIQKKRVAKIIPVSETQNSAFEKVAAGMKRFIYWTIRFVVPFVYSHEITSFCPIFKYDDKNTSIIRNFQQGKLPVAVSEQKLKENDDSCEFEENDDDSDFDNHDQDDVAELYSVLVYVMENW